MSNKVVSLRDAVLGKAATFKTKEVEVDGNTFVMKQLSVKGRKEVLSKATKNDSLDPYEFFIWATIYCTHDTEGKRVFEPSDYEALIEFPSGGLIDTLGAAASSLLNGDEGNV